MFEFLLLIGFLYAGFCPPVDTQAASAESRQGNFSLLLPHNMLAAVKKACVKK